MRHADRFLQLQNRLASHQELWRPAPFHQARPAWTRSHPALAAEVLALDETALEGLAADPDAAGDWLGRRLPGLAELRALSQFGLLPRRDLAAAAASAAESVPARKRSQIEAFAAVAPQLAAGDAAGGRPGEDGGWQQDSKAIAPAAAGEIRSRDDVVRTLARVCDYLVRHEPTNPVQFLLRRAQRMMGMSFLELMRDMAPDGLEQAETVVGEKLETEDKEEE